MGKRKRSGSFSKYEDGSKKSDDGDSQEEMDGESVVIQKGNSVNGVRYSARVQEKQEKLRREASPSKQTIADSNITATIAIPSQTTAIGEEVPEVYPIETSIIPQSLVVSGEKKKKRTWELWSQEDKQLFFEALNEFGKDFDAIQNYLASKLKPKSKVSCSQTVAKNKDQVRHFYYRTWNKISKYLTFPKDMKKAYQELYGLINYGELRKKQRVLNLKTAVKLSELVERGTTTIKVRGKTFRIKTPVCRALKKLNQLDDVDHIRVPCKLCVELVPHDGDTWASIQRVSHNPRIKLFVPLQRTLASLIVYLEERWITDQNRLKEEFSLTMFGRPRTRLRLIPVENRDLSVPVFKFSEVTSATKISLNSYVQNRLQQERQQDSSMGSKKFKRKPKSPLDVDAGLLNRDPDYLAEADVSDADGCEAALDQFKITLRRDKPHCATQFSSLRQPEILGEQENSNGFPDNAFWSVHEENANAAAETDPGETDYGFDDNAPSPTECDYNTCDEDCMEQGGPDDNEKDDKQITCAVCKPTDVEENLGSEKQEKLCSCAGKKSGEPESISYDFLDSETVARGWNAEEAGTITLGQIYLMLGKADKLCFEYVWDKSVDDKMREDRAKNLVERLVNVARLLKKKKNSRAKINTNLNIVSSNAPLHCSMCSAKVEPHPSGECNVTAQQPVAKDVAELSKVESPPRTAASSNQQGDTPEENKAVVRSSLTRTCKESSTLNELNRKESCSNDAAAPLPGTESQELLPLHSSAEPATTPQRIDEPNSHPTLTMVDSIISKGSESSLNGSNLCSKQLSVPPQSGLIDISTLANNNNPVENEANLRRVGANIKATILPAPPTIIRPVSIPDTQTLTIGTCQTTTLTSVGPTTTVLVSEPAMFAGLSSETPSFVAIQPCPTVTTSTPSPQNTQETKFRRPADIPILMKPPANDERSTNEDGSTKVTVPKPFLDLPKGNRRIGRRPAWKQRVIIPRMLPLLPKPDATLTTLIAIPPVGISVMPVSAENLTTINTLPVTVTSEVDSTPMSATIVTPAVSMSTGVAVAVSSILSTVSSNERTIVTSSTLSGSILSVSGAVTPLKKIELAEMSADAVERPPSSKNSSDSNLQGANRSTGFEESLDNLSLSSFMDISIPESTRFIASDLRLEELEYSNSSISLSGMLDESSRKNTRDPPLLDTPKKGSGSDDLPLQIPSPQRGDTLDTPWNAMNEASDLFMGGLFSGNETLRPASSESLSEGDLNFQSVMGDNSLDFDSKLGNFSTSKD